MNANRLRSTPARQRGSVLFVALVLLIGVTLISTSAVSTSVMEIRMAGNLEAGHNNFQTALAAIDFVIADPTNLPTTGPLDVPSAVTLSGTPFTVSGTDTVTADAMRTEDCAAPPRMRSATSMKAYSAFSYEISADVAKGSSGMGTSGMVQGYMLLGPKC